MRKLEGIFNPSRVLALEDTTIEDVIGETAESKIEREHSTTKLEALRKALDALNRIDRGRWVSLALQSPYAWVLVANLTMLSA